jgi:hypothetical protein
MNLPQSTVELARVLGVGATLLLADCAKLDRRKRASAGYRIRIPCGNLADDHHIVRTIGREQADKLHHSFAGETISYPARRMKAIRRDISIARDFHLGIPIPAIVTSYGVSERTVTRALDRISHGDIQRAGSLPPATPTPPGLGSYPPGPLRV